MTKHFASWVFGCPCFKALLSLFFSGCERQQLSAFPPAQSRWFTAAKVLKSHTLWAHSRQYKSQPGLSQGRFITGFSLTHLMLGVCPVSQQWRRAAGQHGYSSNKHSTPDWFKKTVLKKFWHQLWLSILLVHISYRCAHYKALICLHSFIKGFQRECGGTEETWSQ